MQIEKNKKINEAIDLLIEGGVDLQDLRYVMANILKPFAKGIFYSKVFDKNP